MCLQVSASIIVTIEVWRKFLVEEVVAEPYVRLDIPGYVT